MLGVHDGTFWLRNMLTGGNRITDLLRDEFDLGFAEAERAKENILRSNYAKEIMAAVKPAIHDLVRNVKTNLSYMERTAGPTSYDVTYIVGGGARLPGVRKQLASTLQLEIQNVRELKHVTVSPKADIEFVRNNLDRLAVAIGAALSALDRDATGVTFLPRSEVRAARISRSRGLMMAAGVAVWLILLTIWGMSVWIGHDIGPQLAAYRELARKQHENTQELSLARDTRAEEEALQYLLSASVGRDQTAQILEGVVQAFAEANRSSRYRFRIVSYNCVDEEAERAGRAARRAAQEAVGEVPEAAPRVVVEDTPPVVSGTIRGRVILPRGGAYGEAYTTFLSELLGALRQQPELTKGKAPAAFQKGSQVVEAKDGSWLDLAEPGDVIRLLPDGPWCTIAEVPTSIELRLAQPYGADSAEGEAALSRVLLAQFNEETLEFDIHFEVPREAPTDLLELLGTKQET
jgi:hypothetical protein